ncbi:hypothetical protein GQ457_11G022020 [Hibiscus cannabinus]
MFQIPETAPLNPHQLPLYNPLSTAAKMERSRLRSADNAIHIIPPSSSSSFALSLFGCFPAQGLKIDYKVKDLQWRAGGGV